MNRISSAKRFLSEEPALNKKHRYEKKKPQRIPFERKYRYYVSTKGKNHYASIKLSSTAQMREKEQRCKFLDKRLLTRNKITSRPRQLMTEST